MSELVEADVAQNAQCHEPNQSGVQEDETGLSNVCVIEEDQSSGGQSCGQRVARFPHDPEDGRHGESTHGGGHGSVCDIGDLVGDVRVSNVLKEELALVSNQPSSESEEEFAKRRVDIEEVGTLKIVRCELRDG